MTKTGVLMENQHLSLTHYTTINLKKAACHTQKPMSVEKCEKGIIYYIKRVLLQRNHQVASEKTV